MNKLIATGTIVDNEDVTIAASVYEEVVEESGSGDATGNRYVTLSFKKYNADAMPAAPLTFDDIAGEVSGSNGSLVVPGFGGAEDVELGAPTAIKYAKTKAFVKDGKAQIYAALRYNY